MERSGHSKSYNIPIGYGFFVPAFAKAKSMAEVGEILDQNLLSEDISPIVGFLDLKIQEIARPMTDEVIN